MHTVVITCEEDYYMDIDFVRAQLLDPFFAIASLTLTISLTIFFLPCHFVPILPSLCPSILLILTPPQITWTAKIGKDTEPPQTTIQDTNSDFEYSGTWTTSSDDIPSLSEFKGGTAQ